MGDVREYDGPFLRELLSSTKTASELYEHLGKSARYSRFLREKIVEAVLRCMDGGGRRDALVNRVLAEGVRVAMSGRPYTAASLNEAIRSDEEWVTFQKDRIMKIAGMCEKELTAESVDKLMAFEGFDAIRCAMETLQDHADAPAEPEAEPAGVCCSVTGSAASYSEAAEEVDEDWLEEFEQAYGREAFVHEYVLVRRLGVPLTELYKRHFQMYQTISDMQRSYLDKHLTESEFVKTFVPAILTDDGVVARYLSDVLRSEDYHDNMCSRLQTVHRALYGEPMTQEESSYLFNKKVLAERLTLQCERLNEIVMDFAKETEDLGFKVIEVYNCWLDRGPDTWEVKECLPLFREDIDKATNNLKERLVASLEFNDLLKRIIQEKAPRLTQAEVFRTLGKLTTGADRTTCAPSQLVEKALSTL
jgi:hypothetical protein